MVGNDGTSLVIPADARGPSGKLARRLTGLYLCLRNARRDWEPSAVLPGSHAVSLGLVLRARAIKFAAQTRLHMMADVVASGRDEPGFVDLGSALLKEIEEVGTQARAWTSEVIAPRVSR